MKNIDFTSSTWGFRETPLEEQCRWLRDHGLQYICGQFHAGPYGTPRGLLAPDLDEAGLAQAQALVKRFGLRYASFNADADFMAPKGVDEQVAGYCRLMDKAAKFAPQVMIAFAGWQDRNDEAVYRQVGDALKQVARHAAKYNLTLALENHGGLTTTAAQTNRILDQVREPNIGVNYDPGNFLMHGEDPLKALKELRHPVVFTHFKSVKRVNGRKVYCRLGEGEIDFPPILRELRRRYQGFYTLEYEEPSDVFAGSEDDLRVLKGWLENI